MMFWMRHNYINTVIICIGNSDWKRRVECCSRSELCRYVNLIFTAVNIWVKSWQHVLNSSPNSQRYKEKEAEEVRNHWLILKSCFYVWRRQDNTVLYAPSTIFPHHKQYDNEQYVHSKEYYGGVSLGINLTLLPSKSRNMRRMFYYDYKAE